MGQRGIDHLVVDLRMLWRENITAVRIIILVQNSITYPATHANNKNGSVLKNIEYVSITQFLDTRNTLMIKHSRSQLHFRDCVVLAEKAT